MKSLVKSYATRFVRLLKKPYRHDYNIEIVVQEILRRDDILSINDPFAYVEFLRACFEPFRFSFKVIKESEYEDKADSATDRFMMLLNRLSRQVPPISVSVAHEIALFNDSMSHIFKPLEHGAMSADVGLHFSLSSSPPQKGRLLSAIIRFCQSESCLEVGTGYGVSALFLLGILKNRGTPGHLTSIEGFEPQFSLSSELLKNKYGDMVSCHFGKTEDVLSDIVGSINKIDFMFHDGGHYKENYIRDFENACTRLIPGSVVLFDDIRYEDKLINAIPRHTYEGWMKIVAHPRVKMALEIEEKLGLLLIQ